MAVTKVSVDGKQPLPQQEVSLRFLEENQFAKVTAYAKASGSSAANPANEAVLEDVPFGQQPPSLHLEMVDVNGDPAPVVAAQNQDGKKPIFRGVGFVESVEKLILGFR
jgi:hypothetical protein